MPAMNRRRFLTISGAALASLPAARGQAALFTQWQGIAMGASASINLRHPEADRLIADALAEIDRLEMIFSLYRAESALSRLNATGHLENPPFEMLELFGHCGAIHRASDGLFDPTVQSLWSSYAKAYSEGRAPSEGEIADALARTGWSGVEIASDRISFARPGMALTLNGIAQGYVADRVAALLRSEGVEEVLVDTGEIAAVGDHPDGGGWPVRLDSGSGVLEEPVLLRDKALASSAPLGTVFDAEGAVGHILDPRNGSPARTNWKLVSVTSRSATLADGLSTAMSLMTRLEIDLLLAQMPDARLVALL